MNLDFPHAGTAITYDGWLEISGWAVSSSTITDITITDESGAQHRASWGFPRPDVAQALPDAHMGLHAGFWCDLDTSTSNRDSFTLEVRIRDEEGHTHHSHHPITVLQKLHRSKSIGRPRICAWCESEDIAPSHQHGRSGYGLWTCSQCGIGFVNPIPDAALLKIYYDDVYWQNSSVQYSPDREHYDSDKFAGLIRAHHPTCLDLIEIGCGPGLLLNGLRKRGFSVSGQDYSNKAAEIANATFGITVKVAPISDFGSATYDAILLRHVLEHSPSPHADLSAAVDRLRPGGLILLATPNLDSLAARTLHRDWEWFVPPAHLFYFSPRSLDHFARAKGLEILHCETRSGDGVACSSSLKAYIGYEKSQKSKWQLAQLDALTRQLNQLGPKEDRVLGELGLGNEVFVVLRKRL